MSVEHMIYSMLLENMNMLLENMKMLLENMKMLLENMVHGRTRLR